MKPAKVTLPLTEFSTCYSVAANRFRELSQQLGWQCQTWAIGDLDPDGHPLATDLAISSPDASLPTIIVSSGLHGIEGFFGSAVQTQLMQLQFTQPTTNGVRLVLLHALNPYGFAYLRRTDSENVDLNRNFCSSDEAFCGSPSLYTVIDPLLNPKHPPKRIDPFWFSALLLLLRHGKKKLTQTIATGQYAHSKGLFFGGFQPRPLQSQLAHVLAEEVARAPRVVHLDLHTGLGRWSEQKLLLDQSPTPQQQQWLTQFFGPSAFVAPNQSEAFYNASGSFGRWCAAKSNCPDYLYACTEFGTYSSLRVLRALRRENQCHHFTSPDSAICQRAKQELLEVFCPSSLHWRERTTKRALRTIRIAIQAMATC